MTPHSLYSSKSSIHSTLFPIIMVQWKITLNERKRSYWRYTHFPLNHDYGMRYFPILNEEQKMESVRILKITTGSHKLPWLFRVFFGGIIPSHMGIILSHCKDPYQTTSISWNCFSQKHLIPCTKASALVMSILSFAGEDFYGWVFSGVGQWGMTYSRYIWILNPIGLWVQL